MQYWIFFDAGVGGDGFANLLEHATNIVPADGKTEWRIHNYENEYKQLNYPVRFYQAGWALNPIPFRYPSLTDNVVLNPFYTDLIARQQNTIIAAHRIYFNLIDKFKYRNVVEKDQIKIYLYSDRGERVYKDIALKRGINVTHDQFIKHYQQTLNNELNQNRYDLHINIEQAWRDWNYTQDCMRQLNIELPKDVYDYYLTLVNSLQGESNETCD